MAVLAFTGGDLADALGTAMAVMLMTLAGSGLLWVLWRALPSLPPDSSTIRRLVAGLGVGYFMLAVVPPRQTGARSVEVLGTVLGVAAVLALEAIELAVIARRQRQREAAELVRADKPTTGVGPTSTPDDHATG